MNKFSEIKHKPLRIFNRCVLASNIMEDNGQAACEDYLDVFSPVEREEMYCMYHLIKKLGVKSVRELVTEGLNFNDEAYVGMEIR